MMNPNNKALVVLSGGQDSVTCLAAAVAEFGEVQAIAFDYGQRHAIELECAQRVCDLLDVPLLIVDTKALSKVATSALTNTTDAVGEGHALNPDLPASFVPNRNAMFLTLAHSYAQTLRFDTLVTGVCQTDYSGYPDCRQEFIDLIGASLNSGAGTDISIVTPLMDLTKAQTWELAALYNAVGLVVMHSHTCYEGNHTDQHAWGYGCDACPACELRKKGYEEYLASIA